MEAQHVVPNFFWTLPFIALLLAIAILPLVPRAAHAWERNRNKLILSVLLGLVTCVYYGLRGRGLHGSPAGLWTVGSVLQHAVLLDFIPFIVLLFSLYTISGGIRLSGDIPAHPVTNTLFLAIGAVLANFIGTTGASMLLIRPLLQINSERRHVVHTAVFFIFLVSNVGGLLLPLGDPPLLLGFFRGVPFLWTLRLWPHWLFAVVILLALYWILDLVAYRHEGAAEIRLDEAVRIPLRLEGKFNFVLLAAVAPAVALLAPGKPLIGTQWVIPNVYLREAALLALAAVSMLATPKLIRTENGFNFGAIAEVACLFLGIFITMQAPIEILQIKGPDLGLDRPVQFFWAAGALSSFLDNAPTYIVFLETAGSLPAASGPVVSGLTTATGSVSAHLLAAISCGSVFMGANTYIGNGPNFMVKAIAEQSGVRMPSFFGYMGYSVAILIPLFAALSLLFF